MASAQLPSPTPSHISSSQPENDTPLILVGYMVFFLFFIAGVSKLWGRKSISGDSPLHPEKAEETIMTAPEARLGACLTCMHILFSLYIIGFMSALPAIALTNNHFTNKFLPGFTAGVAAHDHPNPACNYVDRRVLMLLIIYELAIIVGLLLYAKLSQVLFLGQMVIIAPLTLLLGLVITFTANSLLMVTVGRFFMGLTPGFIPQINNRLIKELAPQWARANLLWCNKLSNLGSIAAYAIAYQCSSHRLLWLPLFAFLAPLLGLLISSAFILIYYIKIKSPVTFGQLRRAKALIPLQVKYQMLTSILGLDVLLQYIPLYVTFMGFKGEVGYLTSLYVSLATMLSILIGCQLKLERFGRFLVSVIVLMVYISVCTLHLLLDRLPTPLPLPRHPGVIMVATSIYCAVVGLLKIDMTMLQSADDVRPAISILKRVIDSSLNIVILLSISYLGCILEQNILLGFAGLVVLLHELILEDL